MSEGAASLANSKAQWASALQSSLATFRILCSPAQATSKSWKPVLAMVGAGGAGGSASVGAPTSSTAAVAAASTSLEQPVAGGSSLMTPSSSARSISSNHGGIPWRSATPSRLSTPRSADTALSSSLDSMFASQVSSSPSTSTLHQSLSFSSSSAPSGPFVLHALDPSAVTVHRRAGGKALGMSSSTDIFRATAEVAFDGTPNLQGFSGVLASPECRGVWDRIVEEAELIELLEPHTRISKTNFKLGWPANPRDAITISQTLSDGATLLDISTSLPRSPDAPAYLRPAPPYVRSNVNLYAWCIQLPAAFAGSAETARTAASSTAKQTLRITLFWSWDLRGAWLGMPAGGLGGQLPHVLSSLVDHVREASARIPVLCDYGTSIEVLSRALDPTRDTLVTSYQLLPEDDEARTAQEDLEKDPERLVRLKARRALQTCAEWSLPADEGWDVHVDVKAQNLAVGSSAEWKASASRTRDAGDASSSRVVLRLRHAPLEGTEESIRAKVTVQRIAASSEIRLRVNDRAFPIEEVDVPADFAAGGSLAGVTASQAVAVFDDAASISGFSTRSVSTRASSGSLRDHVDPQSRSGTPSQVPSGTGTVKQRPPPDKSIAIASLVRRNYIYFTSLLQEPDAKWKRISDGKGVTVTQLDSIDPTLVVYRAEATFVGVGVWDLFSTIATPGAQIFWDKTVEDAQWLEDAGEASRLMWTKTKAAWPVSARDAVMVETSYKSPSSVHVFSFSTDDRNFFPAIPLPQTGTIRTQVDLRGWSIEALSPTTVHITLIEQSDPRGWTSKSATPAAMTTAVAGVGDYAIKSGGPPIATRLLGARTKVARYDHEKSTYRLEYDLASGAGAGFGAEAAQVASPNLDASNVECELRCDVEMWSAGLDLVVDPPPINVSCLRRHKLSQGGSGMWLTIEHVPASLEDDTARVIVRKAHSSKEKGVVLVNGARIRVDVDQLKEGEAAELRDRKRVKPRRVPLDIMAPKGAHKPGEDAPSFSPDPSTAVPVPRAGTPSQPDAEARKSANGTSAETPTPSRDIFSDEQPRQPMTCALDVLFLLRRIHAERSPDPAGTPAGWALVSQRNGLYVRRKQMHSISSTVVVQRGDKVVEGLTAEDICTAVSTLGCRRLWDERVDSATPLESYGNGANTSFFTTKGNFPFRGRGFLIASITARSRPLAVDGALGADSTSASTSGLTPAVYFHASASFPERNASFPMSKINTSGLPLGKVLIDGWILETLDPYSSTLNYPIPSTRCTHVVAIDYAGSLPLAVNALWNANLPRSILAVEEYVKSRGSLPSIRSPPSFMHVLGDGRDEDTGLVWGYDDDTSARSATLIGSSFSPADRALSVLVHIDSEDGRRRQLEESKALPSLPFPSRQTALSNASTTKGAAQAAIAALPSMQEFGASATSLVSSNSDVSRTMSMSSMRSTNSLVTPTSSVMRTARPSAIRAEIRKPRDITLVDIEVELRHYAAGYDIVVTSELDTSLGDLRGDEDDTPHAEDPSTPLAINETGAAIIGSKAAICASPTSLSAPDVRKPLALDAASKEGSVVPCVVTSYDLPPSAVLAATLDPSARPRRHLVRIALPTSTFLEAHKGLMGGSIPADAPQWYRDLRFRGAALRVSIRPKNAAPANLPSSNGTATPTLPSFEDIDSQQVPVYYGGKRLDVVHVNQTSAMLQRESERKERYARLERIPAPPRVKPEAGAESTEQLLDDRLPVELQHAVAAALSLKADPAVLVINTDTSTAPASTHATTSEPPTPIAKSSRTKAPAEPSSTSAQLMSILNSYPLTRGLGAGTAVTATHANGGIVTNRGAPGGANAQGSSNGTEGEGKGEATLQVGITGSMPGSMAAVSANANATATAAVRALNVKNFSLATLILVALASFLLGSLVRGLTSPADFVLVPTSPTAMGGSAGDAALLEVRRMLQGWQGQPSGDVAWRELRRLVEIKHIIAGWDLVVAIAHR